MRNVILLLLAMAAFVMVSCELNNPGPSTSESNVPSSANVITSPDKQTEQTDVVYPVSEKIKNYLSTEGQIKGGSMKKLIDDIVASPEICDVDIVLYNLKDFSALQLDCTGAYNTYGSIPTSMARLHTFNAMWPITNMHAVNDDLVYSIHTIEKDSRLYQTYFFFSRSLNAAKQESWTLIGRVFFMNKTLSFSDFSSISVGSAIDQVAAIDPVADFQFDKSIPEKIPEGWYVIDDNGARKEAGEKNPNYYLFRSYHLLTDGILTITYTRDAEGAIPKVAEISFDKDFSVKSLSSDTVYNFRIAPEDYADY